MAVIRATSAMSGVEHPAYQEIDMHDCRKLHGAYLTALHLEKHTPEHLKGSDFKQAQRDILDQYWAAEEAEMRRRLTKVR